MGPSLLKTLIILLIHVTATIAYIRLNIKNIINKIYNVVKSAILAIYNYFFLLLTFKNFFIIYQCILSFFLINLHNIFNHYSIKYFWKVLLTYLTIVHVEVINFNLYLYIIFRSIYLLMD